MVHPTPQTADEMMRECLGSIARIAKDVEDAAMQQDMPRTGHSLQFPCDADEASEGD